jgi:hypothetical protein
MKFIETMELLNLQGPKHCMKAVGDYLRAGGAFGSEINSFDLILKPLKKIWTSVLRRHNSHVKCWLGGEREVAWNVHETRCNDSPLLFFF